MLGVFPSRWVLLFGISPFQTCFMAIDANSKLISLNPDLFLQAPPTTNSSRILGLIQSYSTHLVMRCSHRWDVVMSGRIVSFVTSCPRLTDLGLETNTNRGPEYRPSFLDSSLWAATMKSGPFPDSAPPDAINTSESA